MSDELEIDAAQDTVVAPEQATQATAEATETKTLLSDDEGNGTDATSGPPEDGVYKFDAPEDFDVTDEIQAELDIFSNVAKDSGLSQDQYQALVSWQIERGREMGTAQGAEYEKRVTEWADQAKADDEYGGESITSNLKLATQAVEKFSTAGLKSILAKATPDNPEGLGIGNHPEMVRLFYRIGKAMGDSDLVVGGASAETKSPEQRMFPTMYPNSN